MLWISRAPACRTHPCTQHHLLVALDCSHLVYLARFASFPAARQPPTHPHSQKNAFLFNGPESVYFKAAKALSDAFEKKLEEIEREAEQINNPQLDTMERCRILLDDMSMNPFSEWFREPVDHENMGLTDYLQVIKEPQDLGTISKKLERTQYMSPEDFARDVRLVWQNAITYNSATSMCARQPRARAVRRPPLTPRSRIRLQVRGCRRHPLADL
jgi:hypothetical protein